jgi:uncharacterized membrane protein
MSDSSSAQAPIPSRSQDRTLPAIVYVLYLLGPTNGFTVLIGLVLAYASIGSAGPRNWSHFAYQIRTFWTCFIWCLLGGLVVVLGGLLMVVLIGFPILHLGLAIIGLTGLWFFIRSLVGGFYLLQDQAHPRPRTWLI